MAQSAAEAMYTAMVDGEERLGWLLHFHPGQEELPGRDRHCSVVRCYFIGHDGAHFSVDVPFRPYFLVIPAEGKADQARGGLQRQFNRLIARISEVRKEDLDMRNHLVKGHQRELLKVEFHNVQDLVSVRNQLFRVLKTGADKPGYASEYRRRDQPDLKAFAALIAGLREYDVPYHERVAIDLEVRCAKWYAVRRLAADEVELRHEAEVVRWAEPRVCAFDIETTKLPLQFPNAEYDQIFMISYMIDGQGYLIINREVVSEDVEAFEYTPKPEFEAHFEVFNEPCEEHVLLRFFKHMQETRPTVYVTYNGDWFDWPFINDRAKQYGLSIEAELGFSFNEETHECRSESAVHIDAFYWVKRDSYLPQGSQGLKAVTKAKLGYNPVEVDPEDMVIFADTNPQHMASYSVSDAVATYYLYMKYVHAFIFSLSTIIPLPPDEVLRKGSGTLCEALLMVQAYNGNILFPNKHQSGAEKWVNGRLLESETYIGGHVEALLAGVYRSDLKTSFQLKPSAYEELIETLDRDLRYAIVEENGFAMEDLEDYEEVKGRIEAQLRDLSQHTYLEQRPLIYHLDVAAMYPNIILTNRLQPHSIVTQKDLGGASAGATLRCPNGCKGPECLRQMDWVWRGQHYAASQHEVATLKNQVHADLSASDLRASSREFYDEKKKVLKQRLQKYCQKVYKRILDKPVTQVKDAWICQKENDFYVDTVQSFRDRRYEYKGLNKKWGRKLAEAKAAGNFAAIKEASDFVVLYDSLQLAHKCILNSFYGYVMRKGARWYSMEMAGVVTYTGAKIIQAATRLVEGLGKGLELDTDGIWCALPCTFPEEFQFKTASGKKCEVSYPCCILNCRTALNSVNPQYHVYDAAADAYRVEERMSIEFEVDGPYKAMILPASATEGKLIKKRYAVFNFDGSLAELKGFELKRRGELKLVKVFQEEVFERFLDGETLEECYESVGTVANRWLDLLDSQGSDLPDHELLEYIADSTTMSKSIEEYEGRRSCAITTAKRLAEFLGDETLGSGASLACTYIVASKPEGLPTSERAIPVTIFQADKRVQEAYLQKWCRTRDVQNIRSVIDWGYYKERLGKAIQKIITIPAAMQDIVNPVPRVKHPDWVRTKATRKDDARQMKMSVMLETMKKNHAERPPEKKAERKPPLAVPGPAGVEDAPESPPTPEKVDPSVDYKGWVAQMKRKWLQRLVKPGRKRAKTGAAAAAVPKNLRQLMAGSEAGSSYSHILSIFHAKNGTLMGWVYSAASGMQCVTLEAETGSVVHGFLNSRNGRYDRPSKISVSLSENSQLQGLLGGPADVCNALTQLTDVQAPRVRPVEAVNKAVLRLGCVASAEKYGMGLQWDLRNVRMVPFAECPYLDGIRLNVVYIHRAVADKNRVWMLYTENDAAVRFGCVLSNRNTARDLSVPTLHQLARQANLEAKEVAVDYFKSDQAVWKAWLGSLSSNFSGTTMVMSQFDAKGMPSDVLDRLKAVCPIMSLGDRDTSVSGLGWQLNAARLSLLKCAQALQWLEEDLQAARYGHIPLCNLSKDPSQRYSHVADVVFARMLLDERVDHAAFTAEPAPPPPNRTVQSRPGMYRTPVVECRLHHLLVNALLKGGMDADGNMEMEAGASAGDNQVIDLLRTMCDRLIKDATRNQSVHADKLLTNFHEWIFGSESVFWNGAQRQILQGLMGRQVEKLAARLEDAGVVVVNATMESLVVGLREDAPERAAADAEEEERDAMAIVEAVLQEPVFEFLNLEAMCRWEALLYRDQFNYSGLVNMAEEEMGEDDELQVQNEYKVHTVWSLAEALRRDLNDEFKVILEDYLFQPFAEWKRVEGEALEDPEAMELPDPRQVMLRHINENVLVQVQRRVRDAEIRLQAEQRGLELYNPVSLQRDLNAFHQVLFGALDLDAALAPTIKAMKTMVLQDTSDLLHERPRAEAAVMLPWTCEVCRGATNLDLLACPSVPRRCPQKGCEREQSAEHLEGLALRKLESVFRRGFSATVHTRECLSKSHSKVLHKCDCGKGAVAGYVQEFNALLAATDGAPSPWFEAMAQAQLATLGPH